ncbi:putative SIR2 family histone deacetylase (Hst4) [Aspergillus mulundensis]|uniref:NAD-dependent protein deacetylase hst4 n=1 Tax=Aspergillus mulundensis TaxID=1810919 RepID=A0A3D8RQR4_9EURO|nr:NAD-dependent protein deacetylase hst4 [Aspergillus mulundensis]RDW76413.1 NAD-dependent protein deacetylase hst4 [Aspergillus mulundensis]
MAPRRTKPARKPTTTSTSASSCPSPTSLPTPMEIDDIFLSDSELSDAQSLIEPEGFSLLSPDESSGGRSQDEMPPAKKKRRVAGPKERRTQHLDLTPRPGYSDYGDQEAQIDLLVNTIRGHKKIVVIAGAGISTSAGIPDFRSEDGLFKTLQKKHNLKASGKLMFDAAVYQDETLTATFQEMVRSLSEEAEKTSPTAFHHMLARLGSDNRLTRLYTQNIDGIETSMDPLATQIPLNIKGPWPRTIQLHGSLEKMICQKCRHMGTFDRAMFDRPDPPECPECVITNQLRLETGQRSHGIGKMRPRIVLYNEHNPDEDAITSVMNADIRSRPDALIVVGTSLKIPGVRRLVKSLCSVIRSRRNGVTMWINNELPSGKEFEDCFDLLVKGDCEEVARLAQLKRWDDNSKPVFDECNSADVERIKTEQGPLSVVIKTPKKSKVQAQTGMLTPSSSYDGDAETTFNTTLSNPASKGRKLTEILKASKKDALKPNEAPKPKGAGVKKPAPKKKSKKEPAKNAKITTFSKVTKAQKVIPDEKSIKLEKDAHKAMHPLPPGAARTNAPMFPGLAKDDSKSTPSGKHRGELETISPDRIPKGMARLLN